MNSKTIVTLAAGGFIVLVMVPVVLNGITNVGVGVVNGILKAQYKHRIKKGLKDGSIVEIDGQYYEVKTAEEA